MVLSQRSNVTLLSGGQTPNKLVRLTNYVLVGQNIKRIGGLNSFYRWSPFVATLGSSNKR